MNPKSISLLAALLTLGAAATDRAQAQVFHGTISVTQTAPSNAGTQLELQLGSSDGVLFPAPPNPNRGDYFLDFPGDVGVDEGVLITSIARNDVQNGNFHTSSAAFGLTGGNFDPNQYFVSVHTSEPDSEEGNSDTAFAFFDYDDWLGGTLLNDANGGDITRLVASPGIFFGNGAEVSSIAQGIHRVNLQNIANSSSQNGILLVNGAKNEDNFALSRANDDGSFTVFCHDNGENGEVYEQDPVNFVYINENDIGRDGLVAMGRVMSDGTTEVSGGFFNLFFSSLSGDFFLDIVGHGMETGTLIISPEGGELFNLDNIVSSQDDGFGWRIQSRDITDNQARPLQTNPDPEPVFSFAFFRSFITVTTTDDEDDLNPFEDLGDISLREAVNQGAPGSRILFDPTLEGETITLDMGALDINKSLTIVEGFSTRVTIDANQQSRVMEIQPGVRVSLQGLNLTGGTTSGSGGAILNNNAALTLAGCTLSGNSAEEDGGSIYNDGSGSGSSATLSLTACTLSGNSASNGAGGGIYNDGTGGSATLSLTACTLSGNSASNGVGGGIFSNGPSSGNAVLDLTACTLSGNSASGNGGGIFAGSSGNQGSATLSLTSCTLSGNSAESNGGGIFINSTIGSSATLNLSNSTLSGNSAGDEGGGVFSRGAFGGSAALSLDNSILAGNTANTGPDLREDGDTTITASSPSNGRNLIGDVAGSTLQDGDEGVIVAADPRLTPLGDYGGNTQTMHPLAGSPAILSGDDTLRRDQRGIAFTGPPTIGAVKRGPIFTVTNNSAADNNSLRDEINQASNSRRAIIRFDESLDSNTITLDGTQLVVPGAANGLFIDASNLPNGLTIDANQQDRVMDIESGATVALHGLTLTGGNTPSDGGAIRNLRGDLSLSACTLTGNSAGNLGGAIFSLGSNGGATVNLSACTIHGNSSENTGGGVRGIETILNVSNCTVSGNSSGLVGGGISNLGTAGVLNLSNTIVAGNTASFSDPDIQLFPTSPNLTGNNLIGDVGNSGLQDGVDGTIVVADPELTPLGHYGGPTQTMHPLAGSRAILTSEDDTTRIDQRGFNFTGPPTIGAVKLGTIFTVRNNSAADPDSLRDEINQASNSPGAIIRFAESLDSSTITLDGTQLTVPSGTNGLFLDASNLPNGPTIDATRQSRVLLIDEDATAALHGLTLTGGRTSDGVGSGENGGGIFLGSSSSLSLFACTVSGNQTGGGGEGGAGGGGGGIFANSNSTLTLTACTVSGNQTGDGGDGGAGGFGGGIFANSNSTLTLTACTVSGNQTGDGGNQTGDGAGGAGGFGGGISANSNSTLTLTACTVSGNQTGDGGDQTGNGGGGNLPAGSGGTGGGISAFSTSTLTLTACTISGNQTGQGGVDSSGGGNNGSQGFSSGVRIDTSTDVTIGQSIIAGNIGSVFDIDAGNIDTDLGNNLLFTDPRLAPLGNYGGPTQTMVPLLGSPAINSAPDSTRSTDQRGFPITDGSPDIGAVEFQGEEGEFNLTFDIDFDGDGSSNGVEFAIGTDPFVSDPDNARKFRLTGINQAGEPTFTFGLDNEQQNNIILSLVRSTDLVDFTTVIMSNASSLFDDPGAELLELDDTDPPAGGKAFYRLEAERRPIQQP